MSSLLSLPITIVQHLYINYMTLYIILWCRMCAVWLINNCGDATTKNFSDLSSQRRTEGLWAAVELLVDRGFRGYIRQPNASLGVRQYPQYAQYAQYYFPHVVLMPTNTHTQTHSRRMSKWMNTHDVLLPLFVNTRLSPYPNQDARPIMLM